MTSRCATKRATSISKPFHHAQGQVQAGGGPHGAVDDEDAVLLDTNL